MAIFVAIFVTVGIRHETEPVSCQGVGRGPATMTTAGKAMQVVVTCQQLSQTGQGGFGIRGGVGLGLLYPTCAGHSRTSESCPRSLSLSLRKGPQ